MAGQKIYDVSITTSLASPLDQLVLIIFFKITNILMSD
jgi:hypothetical protein